MQPIELDKRTKELLKDEIQPFKRLEDTEGNKVIHAVQLNENRIKSLELLTNKKIENIELNDYVSFENNETSKIPQNDFEQQFKPFASKETAVLAEQIRKLSESRGTHPAAALAEKQTQTQKQDQKQKRGVQNR